jgi:hypothetical protein
LNFAEKFSAHFKVAPEFYESEMMRRTLYAPGRWLWRTRIASGFFWPDRDFIRGVGTLRELKEFELEMQAFTLHPQNARFLRRDLKFRVSAKKVYLVMREVLKPDAPAQLAGSSGTPFKGEAPKAAPAVAPWTDSRQSRPSP